MRGKQQGGAQTLYVGDREACRRVDLYRLIKKLL